MADQQYDCASCKQPNTELFFDQRYKQSICRSCFLDRRRGAKMALDTEWLIVNIPFDQMSQEEKDAAGIRDLEEYNLAKNPKRQENPYERESTREIRDKKVPYKDY